MGTRVTLSSSSLSTHHLIHNLLRLPEAPSSVCLFLRPFSLSSSISQSKPRFQSYSSKPPPPCCSLVAKSIDEEEEEEELERVIEDTKKTKKKEGGGGSGLKLTIKEKKELASYAHSLGDKLKCQLVGKSGVTDSVVFSFLETLEKNELLKVKIRKTSPHELEEAVSHLEEATGSVAVGQIGRTVILYRPSPTKMKAEEKKKKEVQRMSVTRRQKKFTPFRKEYYSERPDGAGRRGSSRLPTTARFTT